MLLFCFCYICNLSVVGVLGLDVVRLLVFVVDFFVISRFFGVFVGEMVGNVIVIVFVVVDVVI